MTENAKRSDRLSVLRDHARRLGPFEALSGAEFLRRLYEAVKKAMRRYSYRQYAEDFGFGHTNYLHLICKGTRPLTVNAAERIAEALGFKERERRYFVLLARYESSRSSVEREVFFEEIVETRARSFGPSDARDGFEYFSEWFHAAVREAVLLPDFRPDPEWISKRLLPRVTLEEARRSWELLTRLNLVHRDEASGRWLQSEARISQPAGARGLGIIRYHQKMAELGKECVTRVPSKRRDVTALTVPMTRALFERLKQESEEWQTRILAASENLEECEDIYQVNIQLFPLTHARSEDKAQ